MYFTMRFESLFKSSFGNVKEYDSQKKLKLSLSPSQQWARCQWPQAALWLAGTAGKSLRQSQRQSCLGVVAFDSIPETSRNLVVTCTQAI